MKLDWNIQQMRTYVDEIRKKEMLTDYDLEVIDFYCSYINDFKDIRTKKDTTFSLEENMLEELIIKFNNVMKLLSQDKNIYNMFITTIDSLGKLYRKKEMPYYIFDKKIKEKEIFDQSYDVFSSINENFTTYLDYIYQNNLLKIRRPGDKYFYPFSYCYPDLHNKMGYIYISETKNDSKIESVVNHELAHSISVLTNTSFFENRENPYWLLRELHPIYMLFYTNNLNYNEKENISYIKANYNYLISIKETILNLSIIYSISKLKNINLSSIISHLREYWHLKITDFDLFYTSLLNTNIYSKVSYLLSTLLALHLLEQDFDKSKVLFSRSFFIDLKTITRFIKTIDFDINNVFYGCELFNKTEILTNEMIRKR